MELSIKNTIIGVVIILLILIIGAMIWNRIPQEQEQVACTLEAKLCPDGSYVGRVGPNCEFAACPQASNIETFSNELLSYQYPPELSTQYISTVDWPPQIDILDTQYTCVEAGTPQARAGRTQERMINGTNYCVTDITEGAAGSVYTQYAYTTLKENKHIVSTFSIREVQCGNYDEVERAACETEQRTFNLDTVIDQIMQSVTFK